MADAWLTDVMASYVNHDLLPVESSADFIRVKRLPRRDPLAPISVQPELRARVLRADAELEPNEIQWRALAELRAARGLFAPINVGGGKTLICWSAPSVLGVRGLYLTQAKLVKEAERERKKYEALGLIVRADTEIRSYSFISTAKNARWLAENKFGVVMADECHALRDISAARTKRFCWEFDAREELMLLALSGTVTKRSVNDYGHLAYYALRQNDSSFLPNKPRTTMIWAEALDLDGPRRPPGVLRELCGPDENVRQGYRRRMHDTVGVVASTETAVACPLEIREIDWTFDPEEAAAVKRFEETWARPDGEEIVEAFEHARVLRQLKLGGFYFWDWPGEPDLEWLEKRAAWRRELRRFLTYRAEPGLDSPALVEQALRVRTLDRKTPAVVKLRGLEAAYDAWRTVANRPEPPTRWRWVSRGTVREIARWVLRRKCIVWTDVVAFGEALAAEIGTRWYGAGNDGIANENGHRTIVASIQAHGTGRNLQRYARSLIACGLPTGATVEQLIGRTHRPGQNADLVSVYYMKRFRPEMHSALRDARYIEETTGNKQKLLLAQWPEGRP